MIRDLDKKEIKIYDNHNVRVNDKVNDIVTKASESADYNDIKELEEILF